MRMIVLSILNQKGGVAKTTSAVTLAHGLALAGKKTLLVDLDAQGNCADALGLAKRGGLYSLLFDSAARAVTPSGRQRLDVVTGDKVSTVEAKERLTGVSFREQKLRAALERLEGYDVAVLDTAPGVDILQVSALVACTHFMIPVALDHLAVVGAGDALGTVATLQQVGQFRGTLLGLLPTMWERTTRESHEQLTILAKQYPEYIWPPIPLDVKAREAPAYGQTLWEYAPKTRALVGVHLADQIVGGYRRVLRRLLDEVF